MVKYRKFALAMAGCIVVMFSQRDKVGHPTMLETEKHAPNSGASVSVITGITALTVTRKIDPSPRSQTQLKDDFSELWRLKNRPALGVEGEQLLIKMADDPAARALAAKTLTETGFARATFGAQQAEARITAIRVLEESGRHGDAEDLVATTRQLAQTLSAAQVADKGRSRGLGGFNHSLY